MAPRRDRRPADPTGETLLVWCDDHGAYRATRTDVRTGTATCPRCC